MFTVCPKCTLTLAVTAADLRTGQGYVRCGRCLNVFNALLALSEEPADQGAPAPVYSQADPASTSQITAALASHGEMAEQIEDPPEARVHAPHDATDHGSSHGSAYGAGYGPGHGPGHAPEDDVPRTYLTTERSSDGAIENESSLADGTGSFETIVLEGDAITQTEEYVPEESIDSEIAALTLRLNDAARQSLENQAQNEFGYPDSDDGAGEAADSGDSPLRQAAALGADLTAGDGIVAAPPRRRADWVVGCAALVLLLAVQAIDHWRDALAATPAWSAPISRVYAGLGVPLDPHWNLAAYDVRQQGAASDPADSHVIHVRLSLANREQRSQPVPLLRLTLLDRYGKPIAARDLTPAEYWPAGHAARSFLAHDERIDSEVAVRDPAADSASFELDVCLKSPGGVVRCAGDTTAAAAPIP